MNASAIVYGWLIAFQALGGLGDLFDSTSKDFGNVPRGSVNVHRFTLKNTTANTLSVDNVRSTCVCAVPTAIKPKAAPGEEIVIEVKYDTTSFVGARGMTVYVTFQAPGYETVQLRVAGFSRQDVVFNPGQIDFGVVPLGTAMTKRCKVEYAGALDWKITEVVPSKTFPFSIEEIYRKPGRVGYEVTVTLPADAPAGTLSEALQLKTNDSGTPVVRLQSTAVIEAALTASPNSLDLGSVKVGEKVTKKILLRGNEPFTVKAIGGVTDAVQVECTKDSRKVHVLSVEFEAKRAGAIDQKLMVHTDMPQQDPLAFHLHATVKP